MSKERRYYLISEGWWERLNIQGLVDGIGWKKIAGFYMMRVNVSTLSNGWCHGATVPPPNESWKCSKCGHVIANSQAANDGFAMVTHLNREERWDNLSRVYYFF
jgi:hypothetical protein